MSQIHRTRATVSEGPGEGDTTGTGLARRLLERAQTREERVKLFREALATPEARKKALALGADPDRLRAAVPL